MRRRKGKERTVGALPVDRRRRSRDSGGLGALGLVQHLHAAAPYKPGRPHDRSEPGSSLLKRRTTPRPHAQKPRDASSTTNSPTSSSSNSSNMMQSRIDDSLGRSDSLPTRRVSFAFDPLTTKGGKPGTGSGGDDLTGTTTTTTTTTKNKVSAPQPTSNQADEFHVQVNSTRSDDGDGPPSPTRIKDHVGLMQRAKGIEEMGEDRLGVLERLASTSFQTIKSGPMHVAMLSYLHTIAKKAWLSERVDLMIKHATNIVVPDGTLLVQKGDMIHHVIIVLNDGGLLVSPNQCYERGSPFGEKSLVRVCRSDHALIAMGSCELVVLDGRTFRKETQSFTMSEKENVRSILMMSAQFKHLHFSVLDELGEHLQKNEYKEGEPLMVEGEIGQDMLFLENGVAEVRIRMGKGNAYKVVAHVKNGSVVGEGALFDANGRRSATVVATENVQARRLLFDDFHRIAPTALEDLRVSFLRQVLAKKQHSEGGGSGSGSKFEGMSESLINDLCRRATMKFYNKGDYILREGDPVTALSCLYIVKRGTVGFEKTYDEKKKKEVRELGQVFGGSVFGEGSLLNRDIPRSASCFAASDSGVECALITFKDYDEVVTEDVTNGLRADFEARDTGTFSNAKLSDIEVLRDLGMGAYGKVFLVRHTITGRVCAMKEIKIADADQSQCVIFLLSFFFLFFSLPLRFVLTYFFFLLLFFSSSLLLFFSSSLFSLCPPVLSYGRHILEECDMIRNFRHPFVVKMYGTLMSQTCIYMALEPCMGGELLNAIQYRYDVVSRSQSVRFYVAQMIEVLSYLHRQSIVYRDVKPENLLVGNDGYLLLVDFSVAKRCPSGETFTLCGTPEYTAPEVYQMTGHTTTADWWSLGILMHELSVGVPPFQGEDTSEIMEGLQRYERLYPDSIFLRDPEDELNRITLTSEKMIKSLLCPTPYQRLGKSSHSNSDDLRQHVFFNGFSWTSLRAKTMNPPFKPSVESKYDGTNFDETSGRTAGTGDAFSLLGQDRGIHWHSLPKWAQDFGTATAAT